MKRCLFTFIIALSVNTFQVFAEPLVFAEQNFSIEVPEDWEPISPNPPQTLAAMKSSDGSKQLMIIATKLPETEQSTGLRNFQAGLKDSLAKQGWQFDPERQVAVHPVSFTSLTARKSPAVLVAYTASAGQFLYLFSFRLSESTATNDLEIGSIIQSFRLLKPVVSTPAAIPSRIAGPQPKSIIGGAVIFALVSVVVVGTWILYRIMPQQKMLRVATGILLGLAGIALLIPPLAAISKFSELTPYQLGNLTGSLLIALVSFALARHCLKKRT